MNYLVEFVNDFFFLLRLCNLLFLEYNIEFLEIFLVDFMLGFFLGSWYFL